MPSAIDGLLWSLGSCTWNAFVGRFVVIALGRLTAEHVRTWRRGNRCLSGLQLTLEFCLSIEEAQ